MKVIRALFIQNDRKINAVWNTLDRISVRSFILFLKYFNVYMKFLTMVDIIPRRRAVVKGIAT